MSDVPLAWITQQLHSHVNSEQTQSLWCTDENALSGLPPCSLKGNLILITNRWDLAKEAEQKKFDAHFSDFDLSEVADNSLDYFFYRISKEKAVVHHLINEAWRCLKSNGILFIAGHKNEGIKTYAEKAAALFGSPKNSMKEGTAYFSRIEKSNAYNALQTLDDNHYAHLRTLSIDGYAFESKPGLFGWNKIDQGSRYLIDHLTDILNSQPQHALDLGSALNLSNALDLGCGYGYLTLATAQLEVSKGITHWTLTDNNAAALQAAQHNLERQGIQHAKVIPADCGDSLAGHFDLILCNPPFHQGFGVEGDLTDRFLASTKRLLAPQGVAVFVVNQFIPLERKAHGLFHKVTTCAHNGSFKVISLAHR